MIKSIIGTHRFWGEMWCNPFHDHITTKYDVVESNRYMTWTMPGQMYDLKRTNSRVHGFIGEINWNRLVNGFCKTVDVKERVGFLFSESGFGEERGEAAAGECESGFVIGHCLHIQLVASDFCIRKRLEFGKPAVMVNMRVSQKHVS